MTIVTIVMTRNQAISKVTRALAKTQLGGQTETVNLDSLTRTYGDRADEIVASLAALGLLKLID